MRATIPELLQGNNIPQIQEWIRTETDPRKLQEFIHSVSIRARPELYDLAKANIDILIAESLERTAQKLVTGTDSLVKQTETLVKLTRHLRLLTIVLIALGAVEFFKFLFGLICHHAQ